MFRGWSNLEAWDRPRDELEDGGTPPVGLARPGQFICNEITFETPGSSMVTP